MWQRTTLWWTDAPPGRVVHLPAIGPGGAEAGQTTERSPLTAGQQHSRPVARGAVADPRPLQRGRFALGRIQSIETAVFAVAALSVAWLLVVWSAASADPVSASADPIAAGAEDATAPSAGDAAPLAAPTSAAPTVVATTQATTATTGQPDAPATVLASLTWSDDIRDRAAERSIHVVGDSLILSAANELRAIVGQHVTLDAETGLGLYYAGNRIEAAAVDADIVVVSLGTNDFNEPQAFIDSLGIALETLSEARCVVWVDTQEFEPGLEDINRGIVEQSEARGTYVAAWSRHSGPAYPDRHGADGYHLSFVGQEIFADLIAATIDTACL